MFEVAFPTFFIFCEPSVCVLPAPSQPSTHLDLFIRPAVHAQRFDLGDMCSELAVDGGTAHAEEDAQLCHCQQKLEKTVVGSQAGTAFDDGGVEKRHVHSMMPKLPRQERLAKFATIEGSCGTDAYLGFSHDSRHMYCCQARSEPVSGGPSRCAPAGACSKLSQTWWAAGSIARVLR